MAKIDLYDPKWVEMVFAGKKQGVWCIPAP